MPPRLLEPPTGLVWHQVDERQESRHPEPQEEVPGKEGAPLTVPQRHDVRLEHEAHDAVKYRSDDPQLDHLGEKETPPGVTEPLLVDEPAHPAIEAELFRSSHCGHHLSLTRATSRPELDKTIYFYYSKYVDFCQYPHLW